MSLIQSRNRTIVLAPWLGYPDLNSVTTRIACAALESSLELMVESGDLVFTTDRLDRIASQHDLLGNSNLADELTPFLHLRDHTSQKIVDRSQIELAAFELLSARPGFSSSMGRSDFIGWVQAIHQAVTGRRPEFRRGAMRTRPDDGNNAIIFPSSGLIDDLLEDLHGRLATHLSAYPATAAVAAYVGLIHCHPFLDGNGRTARVLFNLMLSNAAGTTIFIPFSHWSYMCRGSFILKVRRAMYAGDWTHILLFVRDTLTVLGTVSGSTQPPSQVDPLSMPERRV